MATHPRAAQTYIFLGVWAYMLLMVYYAITVLFFWPEGGPDAKNSFFAVALVYGFIAWGLNKKHVGISIFGLIFFVVVELVRWIYLDFIHHPPIESYSFEGNVIAGGVLAIFLIIFILSVQGVRFYSKYIKLEQGDEMNEN